MPREREHWTIFESPIGPLTLVGGPAGVRRLEFPGRAGRLEEEERRPEALAEATEQLDQYFAGERRAFDLVLDLVGTPFQRAVWDELVRIPFGATVSYSELADAVARPDRVRAVGGAVGRTPVPIIVPCHRVVGANGGLVGYGGGLQRKATLLEHERRLAANLAPEPAWAFRQLAMI